VVIHEFAHKLDMRSGDANGRPPLHSGMNPQDWAHDFQTAYDDLCLRVDRGEETAIDPYATESPAEFFAVLTEYFFEASDLLQQAYPAVYGSWCGSIGRNRWRACRAGSCGSPPGSRFGRGHSRQKGNLAAALSHTTVS